MHRKTYAALTISLAGLIDSGKVLVAATFEGTLCVVADVGTNSKLRTLVLVCETRQGHKKDHYTQLCIYKSRF